MARLFSNRERPYDMGVLPTELLARVPHLAVLDAAMPGDAVQPEADSILAAIPEYRGLCVKFFDGEVAPKRAPVPADSLVRARNLKASAYFLDATLAGLDKYMPDATATRPDGGFFISLTLPEGVSTTAVRQQASTRALNLADGLAFFPDGGGERFLRLPFCALSPAEIDDGVRRLAESVKAAR